MSFVHTHVHVQTSLLDGLISNDKLVKYVKELGMSAVAITDHGTIHGWVDFYKQCKENNIKPILGSEFYITWDEDKKEETIKDNRHMIVLAKNQKGYEAIIKMITNANQNNFYYKPRVYYKHLENYAGDLILTSACLAGPIANLFKEQKLIEAEELFKYYKETFDTNFYAEIQENGIPEQEPYNRYLIGLSKKYSIKVIPTTDAHFLKKEDYKTHQLMMAAQLQKTIKEYLGDDKMRYGPEYYIKTPDEMKQIAIKYEVPEAIENTLEIAEACNVEIEFGKSRLPSFPVQDSEDKEEFLEWQKKKQTSVE